MQRAAELASFAQAPLDRFLGGAHWLFFCAHAGCWGLILFGRPDREDAEALTRAFAVELDDHTPRHVALIDARELEGIDPGAFEILQAFARDHLERSRARVSRVAFVLPRGVSGAVVAGFYGVLGPPFPGEYLADRRAALRSLGQPDSLDDRIEAALAELRGTPPLIGQLRALILARVANPDESRLAGALGLSVRTLQRRLAAAGTSFQKEVQLARVKDAKRRLVESADAVTVIALELGFTSSQHFSRQFRQATGQSPTEWRALHRTGGPNAGPS